MALVKVNFDRNNSSRAEREMFEQEFSHPVLNDKTLDISRVPCVDECLTLGGTVWRITAVWHRGYFPSDMELSKQALEYDASVFLTPDPD